MKPKMIWLIFAYWLFYYLGLEAYFGGITFLRFSFLVVPLIYLAIEVFFKRKSLPIFKFIDLILFISIVGLLYNYNKGASITESMFFLIIINIHMIFWIYIFEKFHVQRIIKSLFITSWTICIFFIIIPYFLKFNCFSLGCFYTLDIGSLPFFLSTIEPPIWTSLASCLALYEFKQKNKIIYLILFAVSFYVLLLLARRSSIIGVSIVALLFIFPKIFYRRIILFLVVVMITPLVFDLIVTFIYFLGSDNVIIGFFIRGDLDSLLTASGRTLGWLNSINLFFDFNPNLITGYYGELPDEWFFNLDDDGRFKHVHNTVLQTFLDSGYIGFTFLFFIYKSYFRKVKSLLLNNPTSDIFGMIFIYFLTISSTESMFRGIYFVNLIFITIFVAIKSIYLKHHEN